MDAALCAVCLVLCILRCAQDGYAVVAADGPGEYTVLGESRAGHMDDITLTAGHVAYITTGDKHALSIDTDMRSANLSMHPANTHPR